MGVSCPNCGSKSVDLKVKKTMYNETAQYYECSFCRMPFIACKHLEKSKSGQDLAGNAEPMSLRLYCIWLRNDEEQ